MAEAEIVAPEFYIGDTETCGLQPHNYPCQIGLQKIDPISFDVLWEIEHLIDPQWEIGEYAAGMHGITNARVADEPTLDEFRDVVLKGGLTGNITMIAHNFQFDAKALRQLGPISRTICSLAEARQCHALMPGLANHRLTTLAEYFGIKEVNAHQALADCDMTRQVLKKISEISGRTLEQMASTPDRIVHVMPFGAHAGSLIIAMPKAYLRWMLDKCEMEPNLQRSVQAAYNMKR